MLHVEYEEAQFELDDVIVSYSRYGSKLQETLFLRSGAPQPSPQTGGEQSSEWHDDEHQTLINDGRNCLSV